MSPLLNRFSIPNGMHLQCPHFIHSALVSWCSAEACLQKRLNQLPGKCRSDHLSAKRKDVHIVVLNPLVGGEHIVDEPSAHTGNFVGADGCANATPAERHSAINCASGYGSGQWNNVIWIIVSGVRLSRTEVDDLMGSTSQPNRDLLFQSESSMVRGNSYTHDAFSLSWSST
jgi:hypothetical protein